MGEIEMTAKDWIMLGVPIIFNGLIVTVVQIIAEQGRIKKQIKREQKIPILRNFCFLLQGLNNLMLENNYQIQNGLKDASDFLKELPKTILEIIKYKDSNYFELKSCKNQIDDFEESWNIFNKTLIDLRGKELSIEERLDLGNKMQKIKEKNLKLINKLKKKMLR